jgi:hypothetical protein
MVSPTTPRALAHTDTVVTVSDYNYVRSGDECTPIGPEPIPAGVCNGTPGQTYMGSSGYRRIPGDTCDRALGLKKDEPKAKPCSQGKFDICCTDTE